MNVRNIAIIAHVDHGKTTLVDALLRQSGTVRANQELAEQALDQGDLERERGITILAKCTSVEWKGVRINIVDTPGHADFGGEVERILGMVDGVLVLVDAAESTMPQTKFVTTKALALGLRPIVIINKVDRRDARPDIAHDEVFDLFAALGASEEQLDFPTLFASAKQGWAVSDLNDPHEDLSAMFELIIEYVPPPNVEPDAPFAMLATTLEADPYLGRVLTGRIIAGSIEPNASIHALRMADGESRVIETARVTKLLSFRGLERIPTSRGEAGDIIAIAGLSQATVGDTLCDLEVTKALPAPPIDPPTLAMTFSVNDSPLAGTEGDKVTSRLLRARLMREAEGNIAITVRDNEKGDAFEVAGRGELQLGVIIETLRREGFEMSISRPRVMFREDPETGAKLEPIEEVVIDVDEAFVGAVVESLSERRGELQEMRTTGTDKTRLVFFAPSRGLIGYHGEFLTQTRGTGVMHRLYHGYEPVRQAPPNRRTGALISTTSGKAVAYALWNLEDRGPMFIDPGTKVYPGMIIGAHTRGTDLEVNPLKGKQLTNIRASGRDEAVRLTTPIKMSLEQSITYIADDELVEVTPLSIRLRKRLLDPHARKRASRAAS